MQLGQRDRRMADEFETLDTLQELLHIPPLPGTAAQLLKLVTDPEVDLGELARTIEQDPPLAARIVGVANSAWFSRGREVVSVEEAIIRVLGLELVRGLALGMALGRPFDVHACRAFDASRYWYVAFVTGSLARDLARPAELDEEETACAFLAGLLHNFGQLVLAHAFPNRMDQVLQRVASEPESDRLALERELLAIDEIQAGRFVTRRWHLPACVTETLGVPVENGSSPPHRPLARLVAWAAGIAEALHDQPENEEQEAEAVPMPAPPAPLSEAVARNLVARYRDQDEGLRQLARSLTQPA